MTIMTETAGLYVSCLRPLCFMLAVSMFHAYGLYVSCLRSLSTTHGYDKGEDCVLGRKEAIRGACCALWLWEAGLKHRGCEAGLKHRGWVCAFWLVLFGRSFRGSFFCSCFRSFFSWFVLWVRAFWSFFSWFVLLFVLSVVLFVVRAFGRSFRGSCFWSFFLWFVLLGARMCFLFDALKVLEACVARSEVS